MLLFHYMLCASLAIHHTVNGAGSLSQIFKSVSTSAVPHSDHKSLTGVDIKEPNAKEIQMSKGEAAKYITMLKKKFEVLGVSLDNYFTSIRDEKETAPIDAFDCPTDEPKKKSKPTSNIPAILTQLQEFISIESQSDHPMGSDAQLPSAQEDIRHQSELDKLKLEVLQFFANNPSVEDVFRADAWNDNDGNTQTLSVPRRESPLVQKKIPKIIKHSLTSRRRQRRSFRSTKANNLVQMRMESRKENLMNIRTMNKQRKTFDEKPKEMKKRQCIPRSVEVKTKDTLKRNNNGDSNSTRINKEDTDRRTGTNRIGNIDYNQNYGSLNDRIEFNSYAEKGDKRKRDGKGKRKNKNKKVRSESINGNSRSESINGNSRSERINGNSRNESINGNSRSERINENSRSESNHGNSRSESDNGNSRSESINGNSRSESNNGNSRSESINGNSRSESINGNSRSELISENSRSERINGNSSSESINGNSRSERISENSRSESISENSRSESINGNSRSESINGNRRSESNNGNSRSESINGNSRSESVSEDNSSENISENNSSESSSHESGDSESGSSGNSSEEISIENLGSENSSGDNGIENRSGSSEIEISENK